nr:MAG TPA: hypothetical protein [Caudoviricetes sp.]DAL04572.1 MAG TPA: hypothetical protein [Caudoviricetes sp.]DAL12606.1 MAG TPA_asm: hypothetical protein [Caudoviricetes sp.]DAS74256.1 MAG TPA: hypothetical protein [Caudoviricetes sp.]DAS78960.1 MAG TPA: hypothetical protein [Caudoviricetes sp.]
MYSSICFLTASLASQPLLLNKTNRVYCATIYVH